MTDDIRNSDVLVVWVAFLRYLSCILANINVYVETKWRFPINLEVYSVQQDTVSTDVVEIPDTSIAHGKTSR